MSFEHRRSEYRRPTLYSGPRFLVRLAAPIGKYNPETRIVPVPDPKVDRTLFLSVESYTRDVDTDSPTVESFVDPAITDKENDVPTGTS